MLSKCKNSCPMELIYENESIGLKLFVCKKCGMVAKYRYNPTRLALIDYNNTIDETEITNT